MNVLPIVLAVQVAIAGPDTLTPALVIAVDTAVSASDLHRAAIARLQVDVARFQTMGGGSSPRRAPIPADWKPYDQARWRECVNGQLPCFEPGTAYVEILRVDRDTAGELYIVGTIRMLKPTHSPRSARRPQPAGSSPSTLARLFTVRMRWSGNTWKVTEAGVASVH